MLALIAPSLAVSALDPELWNRLQQAREELSKPRTVSVRFLADADLNHAIVQAVRLREPSLDFRSANETGLWHVARNTRLPKQVSGLESRK
jgi:hypothetical protein